MDDEREQWELSELWRQGGLPAMVSGRPSTSPTRDAVIAAAVMVPIVLALMPALGYPLALLVVAPVVVLGFVLVGLVRRRRR